MLFPEDTFVGLRVASFGDKGHVFLQLLPTQGSVSSKRLFL